MDGDAPAVSKLVLVVLSDQDAEPLTKALLEQGIGSTKLGSTGGFLHRGNTTLLSGVAADEVEIVVQAVRRTCQARTEYVTLGDPLQSLKAMPPGEPLEVRVGGAVLFVLNVERFEKA
jgi:uncharacterized protein YaaQ